MTRSSGGPTGSIDAFQPRARLVELGGYDTLLATSTNGSWPIITGSNPGTRQIFVCYQPFIMPFRARIWGISINTGVPSIGTPDVAMKWSILSSDGWRFVSGGTSGRPNGVLWVPGTGAGTGVALTTARNNYTGSASVFYRKLLWGTQGTGATVDAGKTCHLGTAMQLAYTVTDTVANMASYAQHGAMDAMGFEGGGAGTAQIRNMVQTAFVTSTAIDSFDWSTAQYSSPSNSQVTTFTCGTGLTYDTAVANFACHAPQFDWMLHFERV